MQKVRFTPARPIRIDTDGKGHYHGFEGHAIGRDADGLIVVPLPSIGDRPAYLVRFKPQYIHYDNEQF